MFLIIAFLSALAVALHAAGAAFDGLAAGLAAQDRRSLARGWAQDTANLL